MLFVYPNDPHRSPFPIVPPRVVGLGKCILLELRASVFRPRSRFASGLFPRISAIDSRDLDSFTIGQDKLLIAIIIQAHVDLSTTRSKAEESRTLAKP